MSQATDRYLDRYKKNLVEKGVLSEAALKEYNSAKKLARDYYSAVTEDNKKAALQALAEHMGVLKGNMQLQISRLMNLDNIIINTLNAYEASNNPEDSMRSYYKKVLEKGLKLEEPARGEYYKDMAEKAGEMVVSLVHTMHPTIFYSSEVRELIRTLTSHLETFGNSKLPGKNPLNAAIESAIPAFEEFAERALAGDVDLVPMKKVSVQQENNVEIESMARLKNAYNFAASTFNDEMRNFTKYHGDKLSKETKATLVRGKEKGVLSQKDENVFFTQEDRDRAEWRTWAFNADADGRPEAHLINLVASTERNIRNGEYVGPMLDLRQNSKVIKDSFSALIQLACARDPKIMDLAEEFFKEKGQSHPYYSGDKAFDHTRNIYQQLSEEDKTAFSKFLLSKNVSLTPPGLDQEIEAYKTFNNVFVEFLKEKSLNPDMPVKAIGDLPTEMRKELHERVRAACPDFIKLSTNKNNLETNWNYFDFLESNIRVLQGDEAKVTEDYEYKVVMLDALRRIKYIDEVKSRVSNPEAVCDRHQMANFENVSDFYNMLHMMKEAGAVTIENGRVTKASMSIMPLLETITDMENGPAIFRQLMEDPLAKSLFEVTGNKVRVMVGFSDGAKSGGNLASIMGIYDATKEVAKIAKEYGLEIEVFQGRGPSPDRGGTLIGGHASSGLSDEVCASVRTDKTTQADEPMRNAASPGKGERDMASIIARTLDRALEADRRTPQDLAFMESCEQAMRKMAEISSKTYVEVVKANPNAKVFVLGAPKNPDVTSRPQARAGDPDWDDIRAITTEHGAAIFSLSMHNVGLKEAVNHFTNNGLEIVDKSGNKLDGLKALQYMYENFEPWQSFVEIQRARLEKHDAVVAEAAAEAMGIEDFAKAVNRSVEGLGTLLTRIAGEVPQKTIKAPEAGEIIHLMADSMLLANQKDWKKKPSDDRDVVETIRNSFAVSTQQHQNIMPTKKLVASLGA